MTSPASVGGDERLRLFLGLRLPEPALDGIEAWQREQLPATVRVVPREHLHLTLAFLGRRPIGDVPAVADALRAPAASAGPIVLAPRRYRETQSVGMLVLDDEDGRAAALADDLHGRLERLGVYEREPRPWLPHVTVVRFRRPPRLAPAPPELGAFRPSDVAVYHSVLRSGGAQYEVLESFALGG